jgi:hypothetical protein
LKTTLKIDIHHLAQFHVEVKDEYDLDDDDEQIDVLTLGCQDLFCK